MGKGVRGDQPDHGSRRPVDAAVLLVFGWWPEQVDHFKPQADRRAQFQAQKRLIPDGLKSALPNDQVL
ncbi:hypothetical protein FJY68_07355 [candidate division WOR-3 bacterium]|uniref:Uncharacterized protein n=1 Tax=candidate division WOR-3 bacterium TaxID=2052148 RepID=A0A937XGJ9_UNCW3|nr:hypothetical protein [candidate division WOR-3 bacterium]